MTVLNDDAGRHLAEMLARYGPDVVDDPARCEGYLRDRCPGLTLETNLLVTAARDHVPQQLRDAAALGRGDAAANRLAQRLVARHGVAEPLARWAVDRWAAAMAPVAPPVVPPPPSKTPVKAVAVGCLIAVLLVGGAVTAIGLYLWPRLVGSSAPPAAVPVPAAVATDDADGRLAEQQRQRERRAEVLDRRAGAIRATRDGLVAQVADLANLGQRVRAAADRAADEDRWPVKVAGRTLSRADADALVARARRLLDAERGAIENDNRVVDCAVLAAKQVRDEAAAIAALRRSGGTAGDRAAAADQYAAGWAKWAEDAGMKADPTLPVDLDAVLR